MYSVAEAVPVEPVMTGLAPVPDFLKTIVLAAEAVVVVISPDVRPGKVSIYPAVILNVTPPEPTPLLDVQLFFCKIIKPRLTV